MGGKLLYGWDSANAEWLPIRVDSTGKLNIDMSGINLGDLGDVNVPTPGDTEVLTWDQATGKWISAAAPGGVTDHGELTGLEDDDHPQYALDTDLATHEADTSTHGVTQVDGVAERNAAIAALVLNDLSDVNAPAPDDKHVLTYDSATGKWVNASVADMQLIRWRKQWEGNVGFTNTVTGTGSLLNSWGYASIRTGTTNGSNSGSVCTVALWLDKDTPFWRRRVRVELGPDYNYPPDLSQFWFGFFATNNTLPVITSAHVGFLIYSGANGADPTIYASNGNGTNGTQTAIRSIVAGEMVILEIHYGQDSIRFWINGELVATHTTNRPDNVNTYLGVWITNAEAADKRYDLAPIELWRDSTT